MESESDKAQYAPHDFTIPLIIFPHNKTVIFVGPPRIGKTQFALAHFKHPIIVRGKQDWNRLGTRFKKGHTDGIDGIVLENIDFRKWAPQELKHTMECEFGAYKQVPASIQKIVCVNSMDAFWPDKILPPIRDAIEARIQIFHFNAPLFTASSNAASSSSSSSCV